MNFKRKINETLDDLCKNTKIKNNSSYTLCSQRERRIHQALQSTRSRWFIQASAEIGPEELPSDSSIWCPGRKGKAAKC